MMGEMTEKIREFVVDTAQRKGINQVADDELLTANGIIDSLSIFRLVSFLEDNFGIRIGDEEIVDENFQSVHAIEGFVADKLSKKMSAVPRG
jgi:acyl carrier protein